MINFIILSLLFCCCLLACVHSETTEFDLVNYLPGYGPITGNDVFAGYVDVKEDEAEGSLFYWFVGHSKGDTNAPIIVWSNGGPGSSAMIGFFAELGPFKVEPDLSLVVNPHSWTTIANVLFIDHPIGTGMSYANNDDSFSKNQDHVSSHLLTVLQHFYKKHPQYKKNDLFLSGESYAGKYMPALAERIIRLKDNGECDINLQGLILGDAFVAPMIQRLIKGEQAYWNGLMGQTQLEQIKTIQARCVRHIQDGNTHQIPSPCEDLKSYMLLAAGLVNVYDVRKFVPSTNKTLIDLYLNRDDVRKALKVPDAKQQYSTNAKSDVYVNLKYDILKSVKHLVPYLMKRVRILLYNGNFDLQDGPVGTEQYLFSLGIPEFRKASRNLWFVNDKIAGYEWSYDSLTFLTVHGAGHFVPTDRPVTGLEMIRRFIHNEKYCNDGESVPLSLTTLTPDEFRVYLEVDEQGEHRVPCAITTDVLCKKLMRNCYGNGQCNHGVCVCNPGYTGEDCTSKVIDSVKPRETARFDLLEQQEWVYYKLQDQIVEGYVHIELTSSNVSVINQLSSPHVQADALHTGEGSGGDQPFGAVCAYVKKNEMPTWISFDSIQCFRSIGSISSFIAPLTRTVHPGEPIYVGIFNAQPFKVGFSLKYDYFTNQDLASRLQPSNLHDEL